MARKVKQHLKMARILLLILGSWKFGLNLKPFSNFCYLAWRHLGWFYLAFFEATQFIRAVIVLIDKNYTELIGNLVVLVLYSMSLIRLKACRSSKLLYSIIKDVYKTEEELDKDGDAELIGIYNKYASTAFRSSIVHFLLGTGTIALYFINPLVKNINSDEHNLIFSSYFWFDYTKHFSYAYLIQFFGGVFGYSYVIYSDITFFSLIIYSTGQFKIFQHKLRNFKKYASKLKLINNYSDEQCEDKFMNILVCEHIKNIQFVRNLDTVLKNLTLVEYCVCSVKMAILIFQTISATQVNVELFGVIGHVMCMFGELYFYYFNSNLISLEASNGVCEALFSSEWYKLKKSTQKKMIFMILRAQKPVELHIGPFYTMSLEAAVKVLKTVYTYVCVMQKTV